MSFLLLNHRTIDGYHIGIILMIAVIDIPDQFFGANRGTQTTAGALGIINDSQIIFNCNGTFRADLLAQTTADTTHCTGTHGNRATGSGCAGDRHIAARFHGNDQFPGANLGAEHTSDAKILIHHCNAVLNGQGAMLAGSHASAIAKAAILTDHRSVAANFGSSKTISEAFIFTLDLVSPEQIAVSIESTVTGAADMSHLSGNFAYLHTHNLRHGLSAFIAAGSAETNGSTLQDGFRVSAAAGIAAGTAVGTGETVIELIQARVGFHIENLGSSSQNKAKNQTQTA